jgi:hypothetical protein
MTIVALIIESHWPLERHVLAGPFEEASRWVATSSSIRALRMMHLIEELTSDWRRLDEHTSRLAASAHGNDHNRTHLGSIVSVWPIAPAPVRECMPIKWQVKVHA